MGFSIWNYEGLKVWTRPRKVKALCLSKSFRIAYVEQNMCQFLLASICQRTVISWWRVWFSIFFFSPSTSVLYLRPSFCQRNKRLTLHGRRKENSVERAKETKEDKQKTCQECRRLPQIRCILVRSSVFQNFTAPAADTDASAVSFRIIEDGGGGKEEQEKTVGESEGISKLWLSYVQTDDLASEAWLCS